MKCSSSRWPVAHHPVAVCALEASQPLRLVRKHRFVACSLCTRLLAGCRGACWPARCCSARATSCCLSRFTAPSSRSCTALLLSELPFRRLRDLTLRVRALSRKLHTLVLATLILCYCSYHQIDNMLHRSAAALRPDAHTLSICALVLSLQCISCPRVCSPRS